jgi:hypothetical protein
VLVAVCTLVVLGPAGFAAFGPVAVHRDTARQAVAEVIPRLSRDIEVAREGDRQATLPRDVAAPAANPTTATPASTDAQVPAPTPTSSADPTTTPRPRPAAHAHPGAPTTKPTGKPTPRPRPTPKPHPTGSSAHRDTTTPTTRVVAQYPSRNAVTLVLGADEPASFVCSLDGAAYAPCSSPASYMGLSPGWHSFSVRAIDTSGNVDPTPATSHWHARGGS